MMMGSVVIIFTAILSYIFSGKKQHFHHLASLAIITVALVIIGWSGINQTQEEESSGKTTVLGVILLVISEFLYAVAFVIEEKLFDGYSLDPMYSAGFEGFFGILMFCVILPIFQRIPCDLDGICGKNGVIEDTELAFRHHGKHYEIVLFSVGLVVSLGSFNAFGQTVTKNAGATVRTIISENSTLLVWIF